MITLYSNDCPNCKRLKQRLDSANKHYTISNDTERIKALGFDTVPVLCVDGNYYKFKEAIEWLKGETNV